MLKIGPKKAQAAAELAVFGAILIFLLGTIVRSAVGNSYTQNQNFKAMRMAMLSSWQDSESAQGNGASANTSHNSASVLFVEDRLSPDNNKYGDLDRNPYIAQGSGSFTYEMLYPLDVNEASLPANLPIMDVYINGQHFPFITAGYTTQTLRRSDYQGQCGGSSYQSTSEAQTACLNTCPVSSDPAYQQCVQNCQGAVTQQCLTNQCLRNLREWVGGVITASEFETVVPVPLSATADATIIADANAIISELSELGLISPGAGAGNYIVNPQAGGIIIMPLAFITWLEGAYPNTGQEQVNQVQSILESNQTKYKLFYSMVANAEGGTGASQSGGASGSSSTPYAVEPPNCTSHPCKDKELSLDLTLGNTGNQAGVNGAGVDGDLMFDYQRTGASSALLENPAIPAVPPAVPPTLRPYMAWEWSATAGTTPDLIGLDASNNQYPSYDVDGRLKMVTIYAISQVPDGHGTVSVSYEDFQGGDIDSTWDANSCGPKPGLQSDSEIFTYTQNGTYLEIREGKMYDPETGRYVRSANKRDNIDLIQRTIQLSNNTGRFCNGTTVQQPVGGTNDPNPVEVCSNNCGGANFANTCYDITKNLIYVRSRLEDRRGNSWLTNASGQLQVQ